MSSSTTGAGVVFPVSRSVKTSKSSSIVPRPPGRTTNAIEGRVRATFRVKKYFIVTRFVVGVDVGVGVLLKGQLDVHAERVFLARTLGGGLHDARSRAGNDHPVALGHGVSELAGHLEEGAVDFGAGRTEDRHLLSVVPTLKEHERLEQFVDRGDRDAQIRRVGVGFGDHDHAREELA